MQDVGADNSDQSDSSTSRVDLDILHQKDRIIDFIDFMDKRAEDTKDQVLKRKAIEYWNWDEPIIEELTTPDRKVKPIVIYGDKNIWGSPSFWDKKRMAEIIEEAGEEEDDEDVSYGDNSYSPLQKYLHEMERVDMGKIEKKLLEEEPSALEAAAAEEEEEDVDEEEEEDEEEEDEEMFVDDYVYCYKSCVASPDDLTDQRSFSRLRLKFRLPEKLFPSRSGTNDSGNAAQEKVHLLHQTKELNCQHRLPAPVEKPQGEHPHSPGPY